MSEATVEETTVEAETVEAPVETAPVKAEEIKFDLSDVDDEATDPISVFFAQTKPLYNELVDIATSYKSLSNTDDAVSNFLATTDNPKVKALAEKRDELQRTIDEINEKLTALATAYVAETLGDGQTPDSLKKKYQDVNAQLSDLVNPLRPMFVFMGIASESKPEPTADNKRPRSTFTSNGTKQGDDFVKLLNRPSLSGGAVANSGEGKLIREWAEKNNWVDADGKPLAKQGKLPDSVKEAYAKAHA